MKATKAININWPVTSRIFAACSFFLLLGVMLFSPAASAGVGASCSSKQNDQAIARLNEARENWKSLRAHQKAFAACDDGELGEGYSDAVAMLLSRTWSQFEQFVAIAREDVAFQRWAVRHIDASASSEELSEIVRHASRCAKQADEENLCTVIRKSAEAALSETNQIK